MMSGCSRELPIAPSGPFQNDTPPVRDSDPGYPPIQHTGERRGLQQQLVLALEKDSLGGGPIRNTYLWQAASANDIYKAPR